MEKAARVVGKRVHFGDFLIGHEAPATRSLRMQKARTTGERLLTFQFTRVPDRAQTEFKA